MRKTIRRPGRRLAAGLLSAALVVAASPGMAQVERVVSLEEAIELAVAADPLLVGAEATVTQASAGVLQSTGAWLPTLSLNSGYSNSSNQRFDQTTGQLVSESYTSQIQASYEIFSAGRRWNDRRSSTAELTSARAGSRAQRFQTILATKERFYEAAAGEEVLAAAQTRLERAHQQVDFARTRLEIGNATRSDLLRAELEVGNAELAVIDAESALRTARLELGRLLGVDGEVQPTDAPLPETAPRLPEIAVLAARAEAASPSAVAAQATLSARRSDIWSARSQYLPTLRITGGYDWFSFQWPPREQSWSFRLIASLPILNGFQREAGVSRNRAAVVVAEARARDARIAARVAAEDAAREVSASERRAEIAGRAVELAREDLRVQEERYQIGNATILDLQASQVALTDAEVASIRARQAMVTAVARLEAVLGTPIEELATDG